MVRGVFDSVADRYDIMNDVMSGGIHRLWKAAMIDWMAPQPHQKLIDLAGGTGDISLRFLRGGGGEACITDINHAMLEAGRGRRDLQRLAHRLGWCVANAESLPFDDHSADFVTIAFGLRNVTDRQAALNEAHRILKPGGRFLCLEFSHVQSRPLAKLYDSFSFNILPVMGQVIAGDADSYRYLAESIRTFPSKEMLADMFAEAGFAQIRVRSLSAGIACIHSGWKLD
ncbi:MAG TPA: bifunctional demethylmenaquinone methyltransferase/2-methoxy-6-polyprenyl-1,4-benzoquinol methylase UbiE [Alphaproteobacteria bacterium]|nr:bifunctional demethylmenaquinone methyltransferase/2-methoxy-6-polyprenyl-1,4-benzoquinol methylase UbiE [Alphaproteobacteria bacterium]